MHISEICGILILDRKPYNLNIKYKQEAIHMNAVRYYTQKYRIIRKEDTTNNIINYDFKTKPQKISTQNKKAGVTLQHTAVDPIKDIADIEAAKQYFLSKDYKYTENSLNLRNYALFVLSCNCARRYGDIRKFTIGDVMFPNGNIKPSLSFIEEKTNKRITIYFNNTVKESLIKYLSTRPKETLTPESYLFISRSKAQKGEHAGKYTSITRQQAWRIYKQMADEIGLTDKGVTVGCHTPRKTFVYHQIKNCKNDVQKLVTLVDAMNHSSLGMTKRYAGIQSEEIRDLYMGLEL